MNTTIASCSRRLIIVLSILSAMLCSPQAMASEETLSFIAIETPGSGVLAPGCSVVITEFYPATKAEELELAAVGQSQGLIALIDVYDADGFLVAIDVRSAPFDGMVRVSEGSRLYLLQYLSAPGAITTFCFGLNTSTDSDGDGIPDDQDACPHSILDDTVIIGGGDSGVKNTLFPDGCTLADLVERCKAGARNRGQFVRCVAHLARTMRRTGVLTRQEASKLVRCAARARR